MKSFDLKAAQAGATVITRKYESVRFLTFDDVAKTVYAVVGKEDRARTFNEQGIEYGTGDSNDLFMLEPAIDLFDEMSRRVRDFIGEVAQDAASAGMVIEEALGELNKLRASIFGSSDKDDVYRRGTTWVFTAAGNIIEFAGEIIDVAHDSERNVIALKIEWDARGQKAFGSEWHRLNGEVKAIREYKDGEKLKTHGC